MPEKEVLDTFLFFHFPDKGKSSTLSTSFTLETRASSSMSSFPQFQEKLIVKVKPGGSRSCHVYSGGLTLQVKLIVAAGILSVCYLSKLAGSRVVHGVNGSTLCKVVDGLNFQPEYGFR